MKLTLYTNDSVKTQAGSGVWYNDNSPRNLSEVACKEQSNQTGELVAVLLPVRNHPPNEDLYLIRNSKYVIDSLMKNSKRGGKHGWMDIQNRDIFKLHHGIDEIEK